MGKLGVRNVPECVEKCAQMNPKWGQNAGKFLNCEQNAGKKSPENLGVRRGDCARSRVGDVCSVKLESPAGRLWTSILESQRGGDFVGVDRILGLLIS